MNAPRLAWPRVYGGHLCECVGGPRDGTVVFLPEGHHRLDVVLRGAPEPAVVLVRSPGAGDEPLGWYQCLRGVADPDEVYWHAIDEARQS